MGKRSKKKNVSQHMQKLSALLQKENFSFGPEPEEGKEYLLFDATSRLLVLRFLSVLSFACLVFVAIITLRMTTESMISEMGSIAAGRWLQAGLILLSGIYFFLMLWLSGKYVLKITRRTDGAVEITTWRLLIPNGIHVFNNTDFEQEPVYYKGKTAIPFRPVVQAPYYVIRPGGKKMIIDEQGTFPMGKDMAMEAVNG